MHKQTAFLLFKNCKKINLDKPNGNFIFAQFLIALILTIVSGCTPQNGELPTKTEQTDIISGSAITKQDAPKQTESENLETPIPPDEDSIPDQDPSETLSEILEELDALDSLINSNSDHT